MREIEGTITVNDSDIDRRIDVFLSDNTVLSRTKAKKHIKNGDVKVNGSVVKPSYRLRAGDVVEYKIEKDSKITVIPKNLDLDIVYEDESIIVVNKDAGLVTHPGAGSEENTLIGGVLFITDLKTSIGAPLRPGIVHRLDKDTSGIMVVAKTDRSYYDLVEQFKDRTVKKEYRAVVDGIVPNDRGEIKMPVGRHPTHRKEMHASPLAENHAHTIYEVIERYKNKTYLKAFPKTGRTHQIRVHFKFLGYPITGDETYGEKSDLIDRQALHSYRIIFTHPQTDEEMELKAKLPEDMKDLIYMLKEN